MKTSILVFASLFLSIMATAAPKVTAKFDNVSAEMCTALMDSAKICTEARDKIERLEQMIAMAAESDEDYQNLINSLSGLKEAESFVCGGIAKVKGTHMAIALIQTEAPVSIEKSKLDFGDMGRVELVEVMSGVLKMSVYGAEYCSALQESGGDSTKALELIATKILQ